MYYFFVVSKQEMSQKIIILEIRVGGITIAVSPLNANKVVITFYML